MHPNETLRKPHIAKSILDINYTPSEQKERRIPLHLLEKVTNELKKLIDDDNITNPKKMLRPLVYQYSGNYSGKDKSVKIAFDSKKLNDEIQKK